MRKLLDELLDRLRTFITEEDEKFLMVVEANDASNGLVVKSLDIIDQDAADLFWTFADDFTTAAAFADIVARRVYDRRELACKALAKKGEPPWPPLPRETYDAAISPVSKMRALMVYARDLSPSLDEARLVWNLFPARIADPSSYRAFVLALVAHEFPSPWCHHMRVLVRDDAAHPALRDIIDVMRGAMWYAPRLGPEDLERALEKQASDEALTLDERVQALLVLAGLDYAHKRLAEALAKYKLAARYYSATGQAALHALAINGMGEVHARAGDAEQARRHFESALTPALQRLGQENEPGRVDAIPVLLNISLNLGNLYLTQKRWADAGTYYEGARDIAHGMANAEVKMQCLENIGCCYHELGRHAEAVKAWEEGATLARALQAEQHLRNLLLRQREAYVRLHVDDRRHAVDTELRQLDAFSGRGQA